MFDCISNRLPRFKCFLSPLPRLLIFQVNSNVSDATETIIVFRLSWVTTVIFKLTCVIGSFRMRKSDHTMLSVSVGNVELCKNACCHVSFEPKEWLQMDIDLKWKKLGKKRSNNQPVTKAEPKRTWILSREPKAQPQRSWIAKLCRVVSFGFCETKTLPVGQM